MRRREGSLAVLTLAAAGAGAVAAERLLRPRVSLPERVRAHPAAFFTPAELRRGAEYTRPQLLLGLAGGMVDLSALALLVRRPPGVLRRLAGPGGGALAAAGLAGSGTLLALPLRAVARRRGLRAGLVTQSWGGWALDLAKSAAIELPLAGTVGAGVSWARGRWPRMWWLPAAGAAAGLGGGLAVLGPALLDPLFNRFDALEDGEARREVLELAERAGVRVRQVLRVDASRRTTAANAYVAGMGPTRRVVLFDTLLDRYPQEELAVVVAHELAHAAGRDVARSVLFGLLTAPLGALAVDRVARALRPAASGAEALPALALGAMAVGAVVGTPAGRLSRSVERRADAVALELTGRPDALIAFWRRIAVQNLADVAPPRWVRALLSTHPSTVERIGVALAALHQGGPQPAPSICA